MGTGCEHKASQTKYETQPSFLKNDCQILNFKFFLSLHFDLISDIYKVAKVVQNIITYASSMLKKNCPRNI